jgi:hypothetical protein
VGAPVSFGGVLERVFMTKHLLTACLLVCLAAILTGCVAAIGNGDTGPGRATLGQQLVDLQKAKDAGAITDSEFQEQKERLLRKTAPKPAK